MVSVVLWQRIEGALVFAAAILIFIALASDLPWWLALILFFAPDITFAAYLAGPRVGALIYNTAHVYALGAMVLAAGLALDTPLASALGALWLAHSGFDRLLGYGLKFPESFKKTHLGDL
ncbi:DUF4260 domain-containing protein [Pelagibacterium xiamenense]|uniref:DUF4260 domain-containing protein n=1 Tax=Pelagibacterium xiamenense TaxID=2901140 RepID=UPI001E54FE2C|nr:DUF4260 domain-containing protein [Pelagibacterium xiamenense]MCD7060151.1 DUF4260 domain-containing protein [Pelagibacterium xiamenense]